MRKRFAILVLALTSVVAACLEEPVDNEVFAVGDSITWQVAGRAANDPNRPAGNYEWHVGLGWRYDNIIARSDVRANDALLSPEVALIVIGMNDAINGNWVAQDETNFTDLILNTFHGNTCEVVVLPWMGPGMLPARVVEVTKARAYMANLAAQRAAQGHPTVVVDAETLPDAIIAADGIHVLGSGVPGFENFPYEDVARVRLALYWDGINQCRAMSA